MLIILSYYVVCVTNIDIDHMARDQAFMRQAVRPSTARRYRYGESVWDRFQGHAMSRDLCWGSLDEQVRTLIRFQRYMVEVESLTGGQRALAMASRYHLVRCQGLSVLAFADPVVAGARRAGLETARGVQLAKEKAFSCPVDIEDVRAALGPEFEEDIRVLDGQGGSEGLRERRSRRDRALVYLAMCLAYTFLWRVSQYTMSDHVLMAEDVVVHGRPEGAGSSRLLHPWQLQSVADGEVEKISFSQRSSKTRRAQTFFLGRGNERELQLMHMVLGHCRRSQLCAGVPFLSSAQFGERKNLVPRLISGALKCVARRLGFPELQAAFKPHGLRIGGATELGAQRVGMEDIRRIGGWVSNSTAADGYRHESARGINALTAANGGAEQALRDRTRDILDYIPPTWVPAFKATATEPLVAVQEMAEDGRDK